LPVGNYDRTLLSLEKEQAFPLRAHLGGIPTQPRSLLLFRRSGSTRSFNFSLCGRLLSPHSPPAAGCLLALLVGSTVLGDEGEGCGASVLRSTSVAVRRMCRLEGRKESERDNGLKVVAFRCGCCKLNSSKEPNYKFAVLLPPYPSLSPLFPGICLLAFGFTQVNLLGKHAHAAKAGCGWPVGLGN